jgi:SSS family solute:Na+ symporter
MKLRFSVSLTFIYFIILMMSCNNTMQKSKIDTDALEKESVETLHAVMQTQSEWVKVHAAEFLLWTGNPEGVRDVFLEEDKQSGTKSPYRIGIWRVLSQASTRDEEKKVWNDKIMTAFIDPEGKDRLHASETLAKLKISPFINYPEITKKTLKSSIRSLSLYTRWSDAFISQDSLDAVRQSFFKLAVSEKEDAASRRLAIYVLRQLRDLSESEWIILAKLALSEPEDSEIKISLINGAIILADENSTSSLLYKQVFDKLVGYKEGATKSLRGEIAAGLAEKGKPKDLPVLISFLRNENPIGHEATDADIRASAAYAILKIINRN